MHNLLKRQLKKFFGGEANLPEELRAFVAAVDESYESFESDQKILHRAMELSSQELTQANSELRVVFQAIPDLILKFDRAGNIVALKATEDAEAAPEANGFGRRKVGSQLSQLPIAAIREKFQSALQELFREGQSQAFEYSMDTEFGRNHFEVRLVPLLADGAIAIIQDITKRKEADAELERLHQQLMQASRQAGMAEVATGVLHNVGNVLNSINVSTALLWENFSRSQIPNLVKATGMLRDHAADTASFLTSDPRGLRLPGYLIRLGDHLVAEQAVWQKELDDLRHNVEHIKEIVAMQQSYARVVAVTEALVAKNLVEDALRMNQSALQQTGIRVTHNFQEVPLVAADKHKVLQILVNLIRNAKYALNTSGRPDRVLTLNIRSEEKQLVQIQVVDNGIGIAPENLTRIFQHGFTTKRDGHGFGLHSCANAAREMHGNISVHSAGLGCGATFTLELPVVAAEGTGPTLCSNSVLNHDI